MPGVPTIALAFDEVSGDVIDHSGNGHNFPLAGSTARTADGGGATGRGLTQGGGEVFTAAGVAPATLRPNASWTWMANVKTTTAYTGWIGEFFRASTVDTGVTGLLYLSSVLRFRVKDSSNTPYEITVPTAHNVFRNICATYDGTSLRLYVNGVLQGSPVAVPNFWAADTLRPLDGSGANAVLDDFRIFDGALTQEEVDVWRALPADQMPAQGGRLKYESAPGVWTPVPLKLATGEPLIVKSETSPGTWEALP
jgi:hypothetical protein